jgi:serine protease Do
MKKIITGFLTLNLCFFITGASLVFATAHPEGIEEAVIKVADTTGKAVVSISTEHIQRFGRGQRRYYFKTPFGESPFDDDFFRRFFEDFFGEMPQREYKQMGLGSGVIVDIEGYILTNAHVVEGADKITVTLPDGRDFKAHLQGMDKRSDLAIIKIEAHNLPVAKLGDSDDVSIGQWVVAIGNPFGFALQSSQPTVTTGVISALHRSLGQSLSRGRAYNDLIQTDAAINPGNSGGPLVNLEGEVIGINVAIFSTTGGYQGIGFAIPINIARRIMSRLIEGKEVLYGWLGVMVQDLTEELAQYFGVADKKGVLVAGVLEDSPAQQAGIKEGDVIITFDGQPVKDSRQLIRIVNRSEVGRRVKIGLIRESQQSQLWVKIGQRPSEEDFSKRRFKAAASVRWRGIEVSSITASLKERFGIEEKTGVVIVDIEENSVADLVGLRIGDVILQINQQPITDISDYKRLTQKITGSALIKTNRGYFIISASE